MKTKKGTISILIILMALSMALCACRTSERPSENQPTEEDVGYSLNTLLIMVEDKSDTAAINAMFENYGLTVIYDYENFMMYAVSLDHTYSPEELEGLISDLEKEEHVIAVDKDYIYSIDIM